MKETLKHQQAFEYYYSLGPQRSLAEVASKFGVTRPCATQWYQRFNWERRIQERDNKIMQPIREETDATVAEQMKQYRTIIKASVAEYIKRLKDNKIKIDKVEDFIKLVELDMKLNGYISNIIKEEDNKNNNNNNNDLGSNQTNYTLNKIFIEASRFGGMDKIIIDDSEIETGE